MEIPEQSFREYINKLNKSTLLKVAYQPNNKKVVHASLKRELKKMRKPELIDFILYNNLLVVSNRVFELNLLCRYYGFKSNCNCWNKDDVRQLIGHSSISIAVDVYFPPVLIDIIQQYYYQKE